MSEKNHNTIFYVYILGLAALVSQEYISQIFLFFSGYLLDNGILRHFYSNIE